MGLTSKESEESTTQTQKRLCKGKFHYLTIHPAVSRGNPCARKIKFKETCSTNQESSQLGYMYTLFSFFPSSFLFHFFSFRIRSVNFGRVFYFLYFTRPILWVYITYMIRKKRLFENKNSSTFCQLVQKIYTFVIWQNINCPIIYVSLLGTHLSTSLWVWEFS